MRYLLTLATSLVFLQIHAQNDFCKLSSMTEKWFQKNPQLREQFVKRRAMLAERDKINYHYKTFSPNGNQAHAAAAAPQYTIPVVFHILHEGGPENISDAQVQDAVAILNRDFQKLNADTMNVVAQFKNIIGDAQISFQLATRDPNGLCTNGIIRHWDSKTNWSGDFNDYIYSWPHDMYLNIYVIKSMGGGAAGYTFLPGSGVPPEVDAIVILSNYVGSIGTSNISISRVLTHEVGHWLDLEHTWGWSNSPGVSCGDDGVGDTPFTMGFTSCALSNADICSPGTVENVQNYMDYAYCPRMFTIGQAWRMQSSVTGPIENRMNLSSSTNLAMTGITNPGTGCKPMLNITVSPAYNSCSGKTLTLKSFTCNANPTSYLWTANNGAIIANPGASVTAITINGTGITNVICTASNSFGSVTKQLNILASDGVPNVTKTKQESFETGSFQLPADWKVITTPSPAKWRISKLGAATGTNCMVISGDSLPAGSIAILESPSYDFKNNPGSQFTFKWAYARLSSAHKDFFAVKASKDCGGTWTDIWLPNTMLMANQSGAIRSDVFIPHPTEWVTKNLMENSQFTPFTYEENVRLRFYFQEDPNGIGFGNRLYLDDINFTAPDNTTGISQMATTTGLQVYPNPSNGGFSMQFNLQKESKIKCNVLSLTGSVVLINKERIYSAGDHTVQFNENGELKAGIYFVQLESGNAVECRKIVIH
jgi:hypothetical protein